MAEQGEYVRTYKVEYLCDRCHTAVQYTELKRSRGFLGEVEVKLRYQHSCPCCKQVHWLDTKYTRFEYEPLEG
jgi:hypothetical protein